MGFLLKARFAYTLIMPRTQGFIKGRATRGLFMFLRIG
jgi:hypothetical protein